MHRLSLLFALVIPIACGSTSSNGGGAKDDEGLEVERKTEKPIETNRDLSKPTKQEIAQFQKIWELYRKKDPGWARARDRFKAQSPGAAQLMAVTFLKYYMEVNAMRDRRAKELVGVKNEIVAIGVACAPYLVNFIILDRFKRSDGQYFVIDDLTRQDCIDMLERMGGQAVPALLAVLDRKNIGIKGRRLTALALGGTRDPRVLEPLAKLLKEDPAWQVRADAATGLAKLGDRRAIQHLNRAIMQDKDSHVRKRADKARRQIYAAAGRRS
ncbi:MAG: HEAT repeat domain-containing protein [Planctomycetota bacterium]|jgi:hypothetical protein